MMRILQVTLALGLMFCLGAPARAAEEVVSIGFGKALLGGPKKAKAALIVMAGGHGRLGITSDGQITTLATNQVVRTRGAYQARGIATLTVDSGVDFGAAVAYMRQFAPKVGLLATSRGTQRAGEMLASASGDQRPDFVILTSGFYMPGNGASVVGSLGTPDKLPRTLVIHHRNDECRVTPPGGVEPFKAWGGGKVRVVWLSGGKSGAGDDEDGGGRVCGAQSHHGFLGIDGQVVGAAAGFALGR